LKIGRTLLAFSCFLVVLGLTGCVEKFTVSPEEGSQTQAQAPQSPLSPTTPPPPTALRIAVLPEDLLDYGILSDAANILRDALGISAEFVSPQSDCDLYVGTSSEILAMAQRGELQTIQDVLPNTSSPLVSAFTQNGNSYALPLGGKGKVLLINTSLLLGKGLPPRAPATFEEWAKMLRLLKARGVEYPLFLPMRGDNLLEDFELWSAIYGGSSYSQDKPSFSDASRRALIALSALAKDNLIDPLSYEGGEEEAKEAVKGGGCAFAVVWGDDLPSGVEVGLIPPSQEIYDLEKKPCISLGKVKGVVLKANSPMTKEAKAFLRLLWHLQNHSDNDLEALALSYALPCPSFRAYPQENQVVARFVSSVIQGIISPEEAINRMQAALQSLPQQGMPSPQQGMPSPQQGMPSPQPPMPTNQPPTQQPPQGFPLNIPAG